MDLHTDAELAQRLAAAAGRLLLGVRDAGPWADAESLRIAGDHTAQEFLAAALAASRPSDAVLSEEAVDDGARLLATRVWIIDPLDGTREFAEDRQDWAVHVALWVEGELSPARWRCQAWAPCCPPRSPCNAWPRPPAMWSGSP